MKRRASPTEEERVNAVRTKSSVNADVVTCLFHIQYGPSRGRIRERGEQRREERARGGEEEGIGADSRDGSVSGRITIRLTSNNRAVVTHTRKMRV